MGKHEKNDIELLKTWTLSTAATLGSSVRVKGIVQEIKVRLPSVSKNSISVEGSEITLAMASSE